MARPRAELKLVALVLLLVAAWLVVRASPAHTYLSRQGIEGLKATLRGAWWARPAFVGTYALAVALNIPALALTLAGGAVFGFGWGTVLNTLGANLGATAAFWLARGLGRGGLESILGRHLSGLDRVSEQSGFAWLLRLRLIPVVPFTLLNFASGLSAMRWRSFAAATALGILPGTAVYTFFADSILMGSRDAAHHALGRIVLAGALLVVVSFAPALARRIGWMPDRP